MNFDIKDSKLSEKDTSDLITSLNSIIKFNISYLSEKGLLIIEDGNDYYVNLNMYLPENNSSVNNCMNLIKELITYYYI